MRYGLPHLLCRLQLSMLFAESSYSAWSRKKSCILSVYSASEVWSSTPRCTCSLAWSRKILVFSMYAAVVPLTNSLCFPSQKLAVRTYNYLKQNLMHFLPHLVKDDAPYIAIYRVIINLLPARYVQLLCFPCCSEFAGWLAVEC